MRATGVVVGAIVLLLAAPGAAHASAPVPGGRYVDRIHEQGAIGQIKLTLANDGLEFAVPSYVDVRRCGFFVGLSSSILGPEAVAVDGNGRFRHTDLGGRIRGRFIRGGRLAVGRATGLGNPICRRRISFRFRARLTGTPNAARPGFPSSCDPVAIDEFLRGYDRYELSEQGIGCTTARRLARRWHASPDCAALTTPAETCSLGVATCEKIHQGIWRPLARIRCSTPERPGGATELVFERACRWLPGSPRGMSLSAINLDCRTARTFPSDQLLETDGPCGALNRIGHRRPTTCAPIAGYVCTVRVEIEGLAFSARCLEEQTGLTAVVLFYESPG